MTGIDRPLSLKITLSPNNHSLIFVKLTVRW